MRFLVCSLGLSIALATTSRADTRHLKAEELAGAVLDALAAGDPARAKRGATTPIASSGAAADLDAMRAQLVAAFADAGVVVIDGGDPTGPIRMTVADRRGVRATIVQDADQGRATLTARPSKVTPPGRCVVPPAPTWDVTVHASGIDQRGQHREADINWRLATARLADVDGDAVLDAFVPNHRAGQCPEDTTFDVHVMRGACGHLVGTVGPGWIADDLVATRVDRSGYRPLVLEQRTPRPGKRRIPEMVTTVTTFRFRGTAYRATKSTVDVGLCHHCSTQSCTSR